MHIPRPGFMPLLVMDLDKSFGPVGDLSKISSGVGVFGSAAAYALVWELGTLRWPQPGPKTIWSTNRYGERVIMTKQAPHGYVGINATVAQSILHEELVKVKFNLADIARYKLDLEVAMDNAAIRIARVISDDAPVDSGDLRSQIQLISSDEVDLLDTDSDQGTLFI